MGNEVTRRRHYGRCLFRGDGGSSTVAVTVGPAAAVSSLFILDDTDRLTDQQTLTTDSLHHRRPTNRVSAPTRAGLQPRLLPAIARWFQGYKRGIRGCRRGRQSILTLTSTFNPVRAMVIINTHVTSCIANGAKQQA